MEQAWRVFIRKKAIYIAEKMVTSVDDWSPSYEGGKVKVSLLDLHNYYRVCVWGLDDTGMNIDLVFKEQAQNIYDQIQDGASFNSLEGLGLHPF